MGGRKDVSTPGGEGGGGAAVGDRAGGGGGGGAGDRSREGEGAGGEGEGASAGAAGGGGGGRGGELARPEEGAETGGFAAGERDALDPYAGGEFGDTTGPGGGWGLVTGEPPCGGGTLTEATAGCTEDSPSEQGHETYLLITRLS